MVHAKVDKVVGYGDLSADVAKLRPDSKEEVVLLAEWARVVFTNFALHQSHVGIGNFRHGDEEEDDDEAGDKASNTEIHPLHVLERVLGVDRVGEEDSGGQEWRHEGTGALDTLGEVESDFGVFGGTADGEEGVRGGLEGGPVINLLVLSEAGLNINLQATSNNKHGTAKATKGLLQAGRPEEKAADCEDTKACQNVNNHPDGSQSTSLLTTNKGDAVSKSSKQPAGEGGWANEIRAKVGGSQT